MGLSASGARGGAGDLAGRAVGAGPGDVGVGAGGQVVARGGVPLDRLVGGEGDLVEAGAAPGAAVVPGGRRGGGVLLEGGTALRGGAGGAAPASAGRGGMSCGMRPLPGGSVMVPPVRRRRRSWHAPRRPPETEHPAARGTTGCRRAVPRDGRGG